MIACIYNGKSDKDPSAFRIMDTASKQVMDVPYNSLLSVVRAKKATVINVEMTSGYNGKLKGKNGAFDRYTKIIDGQIVGNSKMIILKELGSVGYEAVDHLGNVKKLSLQDVIDYAKKVGIANGKLVQRPGGTEFISPISGTYEHVTIKSNGQAQSVQPKQAHPNTTDIGIDKNLAPNAGLTQVPHTRPATVQQNQSNIPNNKKDKLFQPKKEATKIDTSASDDYAKRVKESRLPAIRGAEVSPERSKMKNLSSDGEMTIEQKMTRGYLVIKNIRSFYYAVLQTIKRKESVEVPTMAVSLDTMYYNASFVDKLMLPELIFVELHEVCHIMMRHSYRRGNREPKLWNIACDLYINKMLCDEFGINDKSDVAMVKGDPYSVGIKFAEGGLYDGRIDINTDTPESIYAEMDKETEENKQTMNQSGQQGQGQGQGQQGQGQQGQGQQGQGQQGQGQGQQGQGQQGQGQGQQGQGEGQGQQGQGGQPGQGQSQPGQGQGQPGQPGQGGQGNQGNQSQGGQGQSDISATVTEKTYKFRGRKITTSTEVELNGIQDVIDDDKSRGASETTKKGMYDSLMKKAKVLEKQMMAGKGKGHYGVAEAFVDEELVPKINWRTLLMNRLMNIRSDEKSLSTPDRRFVHSGMYVEGNREEEEEIRDLKVTIDTSGSMTDEDIAIAFAQIRQMLKSYKIEAEIIFWDDGIQDTCDFNDYNSLKLAQCRAMGRGGTRPDCVFEYFETSKDYKLGRKPKPALIIMFTDGIFSGPDSKYKTKYGRDTIWVISGDTNAVARFKPPFGKVAKFKER